MKIFDTVYGEKEITEPVLVELINSRPLQRLKGLAQYGLPDEYYHKKNFSRYEHSIGVLILLRNLKADLGEQVAGLLHDVSHTAFSHVVDWFLGDPTKEDYQDKIHLEIIKDSKIPEILENHGFSYLDISNLEAFSLLDRRAPSLCVDRLDYAFRELISLIKIRSVKKMVSSLSNFNGQVVFLEKDNAKDFANYYMELQKKHWAGDEARARYHLLAEALKIAVDEKIISIKDLRKTDLEVINLLLKNGDKRIVRRLDLLGNGFKVVESNQGIELRKKFRYIDPEILCGGKIKLLSEISKDYFDFINEEKEKAGSFKKIIIIEK